MKKRPVAVFDLDGVLRDESQSYQRAKRETVGYFDPKEISATDEEISASLIHSNNDWVGTRWILNKRGVPVSQDDVTRHFQELYLGNGHNRRGYIRDEPWLVQGELLSKLGSGYRLAIVSGAPETEAHYALKRNGAFPLFELTLTMDSCKGKKDGLEKVMKYFNVSILSFCDDRPSSIKAAKFVPGVKPYGIVSPQGRPTADELKSSGAIKVFPNVNDYINFLLEKL